MGDERARTYSWRDPFAALEAGSGLSGLEMLQRIVSGELPQPPIADTLDFELVEVAPGHAVFEGIPAEFHYNPIGVVHAGYTVTLLDSAMGCAFVTTVEAGTRWTTLALEAHFTRALTIDTGRIRCVGSVLNRGRRVSTTEGRVFDSQDRLCAHSTSTILVLADASADELRRP